MTHSLSYNQAFWLGHLFYASQLGSCLTDYAEQHSLDVRELFLWKRRLQVQGVPLPVLSRPNRFIAVEVSQ